MMSLEKDKGYDSPSLIQSNMPSIATRKTWPLHAASMGRGTSNTQASVSTGKWLKTLDTTVTLPASHKNSCTQVDFTEVDFSEVTPPKDGFGKVSSLEPCSSKEGLSEIGLSEVGLGEERVTQDSPTEIGSLERHLAQVGSYEVGTDEMGIVEVEVFEIGFAKIGNHIWMDVYPGVPGLSSLAQQFKVEWGCYLNTLLLGPMGMCCVCPCQIAHKKPFRWEGHEHTLV